MDLPESLKRVLLTKVTYNTYRYTAFVGNQKLRDQEKLELLVHGRASLIEVLENWGIQVTEVDDIIFTKSLIVGKVCTVLPI